MTKPPKINVTKNYDLFGLNKHNRVIKPHKRQALKKSMMAHGFLKEYPIVCVRQNGGLVVQDGQNRLHFARELGLPVYWVETDGTWSIAEINSTQAPWVMLDYAESFAQQGNKEYEELLEFRDRHKLTIGTAAALLYGHTKPSSHSRTHYIKGDFRVKDREYAEMVATIYGTFIRADKRLKNARFIEACMAVSRVPEFDPNRLLRGLDRCREKIAPYSTRDAYLQMLEEIYNFGRTAKSLVGLRLRAQQVMAERAVCKKATTS